jgi:hypothetical protein
LVSVKKRERFYHTYRIIFYRYGIPLRKREEWMMAGLFALIAAAIVAICTNKKRAATVLLCLVLLLALLLFLHHIDEELWILL